MWARSPRFDVYLFEFTKSSQHAHRRLAMDLGGHDFHGSWGDSQGPPRRKERSTTEKVSCPKVELRIHVIHFEVHLMSENTYGDVFGAPVVRIGHPNSDGFGDWIPTVSEDRRLLLEDRSLSEKFGPQ
ncbi:unnamed protein product [Durusdinium trenchii]|uniref:Uncharacterized protein n=1 Tax=Durusdinium trenchii TaxID=1381693 RepID=A0ABP0N7R3_9DINO